jgi:3' exoribonuclease, RNase T-like
MIDIEGLGTGPDAAILTIAAQSFDPFSTGYHTRHYYARITLESQEHRRIQDDTLAWWATQPEAQAEAFAEDNRIPLDQALDELYRLAWQHDYIWAQGPTYDINILEHAYKSYNKTQPWQFYRIRDSRTVLSLWPDRPVPPTSHHALEDTRKQIDILQQTLKYLNVKALK